MTISDLKKYYIQQLSDFYTESEVVFIYSLLIEKIVGFSPILQRRFMHQELLKEDFETLEIYLKDLQSGKPYQHILGETEFYGMLFTVNEHVLIPRPETEELLELAISRISGQYSRDQEISILDIGTGSGVIPIVLKKHFPNAKVVSIDISKEAQEIAIENAKKIGVEITLIQKDYLNLALEGTFDVIISNPPYIGLDEDHEISNSVKDFEPKIALFSPVADPLIFYRKIASDAQNTLHENGLIFLEINQKLGQETLDLFKHFSQSELLKDLSDNNRFVAVRK